MKFAIVLLAFVAAASAQFNNKGFSNFGQPAYSNFGQQAYRPFQQAQPKYKPFQPLPTPTYQAVYQPTPAPYKQVAVARVASSDAAAQIVKLDNEINPDGAYSYYYETDNGIAAQAQGTPKVFSGNPPVAPDVVQGSFSWTSPEGQPISITYIADENGYQPQGNAIPTPPPVPAQIARALEYIARSAPRQ